MDDHTAMLKVLLVEDNAVYARLVSELLAQDSEAAYDVTTVLDLSAATAAVGQRPFDCILLDILLPDSSGLETVQRMLEAAPTVPVLVLSGLDDEGLALEAVRAGAQDYLIKNRFSADGLRRALRYAVERRKTLRGLGRDEEFLTTLLNGLRTAVGVLDCERDAAGSIEDFRWRLGNAACEDILGTPERDLVGKPLSSTPRALDGRKLIEPLAGVAEGRGSLDLDHAITLAGRSRWLRLSATRLGDGVTLTATDITLRKEQEQALAQSRDTAERAERARSQILGALSHEMRTPLNTIIGFSEMIEAEIFGPITTPQYRDYIHDIHASARQTVRIMEGLLEQSRFEELVRLDNGYRRLIDLAPDLICLCRNGTVVMMNAAGAAMIGIAPAEACEGRPFESFVHPDYQPIVTEGLKYLVAEAGRVPIKLVSTEGREVHVEIAATAFQEDDTSQPPTKTGEGTGATGTTGAVLLVARDITERQLATRAVIQRETRLRKIMETMVDALVIIDDRGMVESFNPAAERIFGYPAREVLGHSAALLLPQAVVRDHDGDIRLLSHPAAPPGKGQAPQGATLEGRRKDGTLFPLEMSLSELEIAQRRLYIAVIRDVTERKQNEERLVFLATRDHLTGLPNRLTFRDRLEEAIDRASRRGNKVGVLFVDLDNFKNVNDTMGHAAGDVMLRIVGKRLEDSVRAGDLVAHLNGDEFTVLLDNLRDGQEAARVASTLMERLSQSYQIEGREVFITATIGIAVYPDSGNTLADLMRNMDTAAHHAKRQGRNTFHFYTQTLSEAANRRVAIENGLRRVIEREELTVVYQPKVDLKTREVIGAEALLRWTGEELGFVSPVEFIPVAEETGLIVPIGEWVLDEVCRKISQWTTDGRPPLRIAVNLSARQFRDSNLTDLITNILSKHNIGADLLELELTESMLVQNAEAAIEALWSLKGLGITLSIDDFGTGYSSLSYLKRFPIDALKIDQSFVRDIPSNRDDRSITRAIISLGQSLDLKLVAEGVETEQHVSFLAESGCHMAQGYLFAKPLTAFDFEAYLDAQARDSDADADALLAGMF